MPDIGSSDIGWSSVSSGGSGGSGTVTQVNTGTGLTGGPITTSGTISVATNTANTLAGYNNSGVFSDVAIGSGLSLSGGTLTASGSAGVSSFTGDGTLLNNSASTGAVTATQANANPYTVLTNQTTSAAAPGFKYLGLNGINTSNAASGTTTLIANSPSIVYVGFTALTGSLTYNLPLANTCPNKEFLFFRNQSNTNALNIATQGSDVVLSGTSGGTFTSTSLSLSTVQFFHVFSDGISTWYEIPLSRILNIASGGTGAANSALSSGGLAYASSATAITCGTAGTTGQVAISGGTGAPTFTSTPGSGTALSSVTSNLIVCPTFVSTITSDTDGATITFNLATSDWHTVTLGGARTLALSNGTTGQQFTIALVQDATGSRTVTWFSGIKWPGGVVPTLTAAAGKADVFTFKQIGTGSYYGFVAGQNM